MAEAFPLFSSLLKQWRTYKNLSQLHLANLCGVSQRHLSFLETGRANPSKGMVLALAQSLDIPLREQNSLLRSAGFSEVYTIGNLDADSHRVFRAAIEATLNQQEPYPAIVLDGRWNMVMANNGALNFFGIFINPLEALVEIGSPEDFRDGLSMITLAR